MKAFFIFIRYPGVVYAWTAPGVLARGGCLSSRFAASPKEKKVSGDLYIGRREGC